MILFRKSILSVFFVTLFSLGMVKSHAGEYQVGAGIYDITGAAAESNMFGYVNLLSTDGLHQRLFSRAFMIADISNPSARMVFVSADLGAIFQSVKLEVVKRLGQQYGNLYTAENIMLTATHTHVGTGGLAHDTLNIIASFDSTLAGYSSQNFEAVVSGIVESIERAHNNLAPGSIDLVQGELLGATVNRSLAGYNQNADASDYQNDTNKTMTLLRLTKDTGEEVGMINWFAIHNTSLSNEFTKLSGDNKGYAQHRFESDKGSDHRHSETFVAAFANSDEGDVIPSDGNANSLPGFEGGSDELTNAVNAGTRQYDKAVELYAAPGVRLNGQLDYKHVWQNMEGFWVRPEFTGNDWQQLCSGARGVSFITGGENGPSFIDGAAEGMTIQNTGANVIDSILNDAPLIALLRGAAAGVGLGEDDPCQHDKPVLISTGDLNWIPEILPFQIFVIGELAIIAAPAEVTTMSGRRIREAIINRLSPMGVKTAVIAGLANTYSGYLTTQEEYQSQQYEGASTEFGRYSLAAYIQSYTDLADALLDGSTPSSSQPIDKSNESRSERARVLSDGKYFTERWGQTLTDAQASYNKNSIVRVVFRGGHPKNNLKTQESYLTVQRQVGSNWQDVAYDWDWDTEYKWTRRGLDRSDIEISWRIPASAPAGNYRIRHDGHRKSWFRVRSYSGTSRTFSVN